MRPRARRAPFSYTSRALRGVGENWDDSVLYGHWEGWVEIGMVVYLTARGVQKNRGGGGVGRENRGGGIGDGSTVSTRDEWTLGWFYTSRHWEGGVK